MKKKYTIYGNCQGQALARFLNASDSFNMQYQYIKTKSVQNISSKDLDTFIKEIIPVVDLLIYQPVSTTYKNNPKYSSNYIVENLNSQARSLSFPSCYFRGYHPELVSLKSYAAGIQPSKSEIKLDVNSQKVSSLVHDINIVQGFLEQKTPLEIKEQFLDQDFYTNSLLVNLLDLTFLSLQKRENNLNLDIKISGFIRDNYKNYRLFHSFNHPSNQIISYIAERIFECLDIPLRKLEFEIIPNLLSRINFPVYKSTDKNLNLRFEESFTPACRFIQLSKKSPACATTAMAAPVNAPSNICPPCNCASGEVAIALAADPTNQTSSPSQIALKDIPPASPAQVLDGLICGAIFGPPMARPAKYAPTSVAITAPKTTSTANAL